MIHIVMSSNTLKPMLQGLSFQVLPLPRVGTEFLARHPWCPQKGICRGYLVISPSYSWETHLKETVCNKWLRAGRTGKYDSYRVFSIFFEGPPKLYLTILLGAWGVPKRGNCQTLWEFVHGSAYEPTLNWPCVSSDSVVGELKKIYMIDIYIYVVIVYYSNTFLHISDPYISDRF